MEKMHYGLAGVDESKDEPPYFIYKQEVSWTKDPANLLETSQAGDVTAVAGTGQKLYFCGQGEEEPPRWSEEREAATLYGEREQALIALYQLEDQESASE